MSKTITTNIESADGHEFSLISYENFTSDELDIFRMMTGAEIRLLARKSNREFLINEMGVEG